MNATHWGVLKNQPIRQFVIESYNKISDLKFRLNYPTFTQEAFLFCTVKNYRIYDFIAETIEKFGKDSEMLTPADQAEHMAFIVRVAGAKKGIELGVFTGYTSLCFAEALPEDGQLIAIDVEDKYASVGRKYWAEAGVDKRISLRLEGGIAVLDQLLADPTQVGTFDFAYVDADKPNYPLYFERLALLLRSGGFIMFDNTLWSGKVADPAEREKDEKTRALYMVATTALNDPRFKTHSIAFSDGLTIAQKL